MDLREESALGGQIEGHWYYLSKLEMLLNSIRDLNASKVMDVGAGSGYFARGLLVRTEIVNALCVDIGYELDSNQLVRGKSLQLRRCVEGVVTDLLLLMDVLEHVDDDLALLRHYSEFVSSGGAIFITVPAFQFMWSPHDDFLGHKRRYTLRQIQSLASEAGLEVVSAHYFYACVFPLAVIDRIVLGIMTRMQKGSKAGLRRHNYFVNRILYYLSLVELRFASKNRWFGLTAVCLARKVN